MDDLLKVFLLSVGFGIVASLFGLVVVAIGKRNDERLQVGNATGIGFLVGASIGALVGIFTTLAGRL